MILLTYSFYLFKLLLWDADLFMLIEFKVLYYSFAVTIMLLVFMFVHANYHLLVAKSRFAYFLRLISEQSYILCKVDFPLCLLLFSAYECHLNDLVHAKILMHLNLQVLFWFFSLKDSHTLQLFPMVFEHLLRSLGYSNILLRLRMFPCWNRWFSDCRWFRCVCECFWRLQHSLLSKRI